MAQRQTPANLSEDERKVVLLALAHLAADLPAWDDHLRAIAAKVDSDGPALFDEFKELSADSEAAEQILESAH